MEIESRTLQLELLKIMDEFHKICEIHGLTYFMLGGTCLGAIRHKGFIPWDDDMDVGMPRDDYDKFCELAKKNLPDYLELRFFKNTKNSPFHFAKLVNNKTTLIERSYKNYVEGIYIDVFPLDNMSDYNFFNKLRSKSIRLIHALVMNHCYTKDKRSLMKRFFELLAKKMNLSKLHAFLEKIMTLERNSKKRSFMCNFLGAWGCREFISAEVFSNPTLYEFENRNYYGPQDANAYLKSLYGNYMELPPVEKRVCKHDYYYVDLNMSFKEFEKRNGGK